MFLLLHQPVTKYQMPNFFVMIFFVVGIQKIKMENRQQTTYIWIVTKQQKYKNIVFYTWFVVTGWCNERNKSLNLFSHSRRWQIFTIFDHYPPPSVVFLLLSVDKFDQFLTPSLQIANVLNGWYLSTHLIFTEA